MKKKIAILGSTGSIGSVSLSIFKKNRGKFDIFLLSANTNYPIICEQIKIFKPKYYIVNDSFIFEKTKRKFKNYKTKILNKFSDLNLKNVKIDITISSIVGIAGLAPTIKFI